MIIIIILTLLVIFLIGCRGGFPGERAVIIRNAERYVMETYGLTPIDVRVTTLYLWFPVTVQIETKENDFWFQLRTSRFFYGSRHFTDDYLERKTGYILTKDLRAYVEEVTNGQGRVWVSVGTGGDNLRGRFTLQELEENPSIASERLRSEASNAGLYRFGIMLYDDIADIDYDLLFSIYSRVFELGLDPSWISFSFMNREGIQLEERLSVSIFNRSTSEPTFDEISSSDDLKRLFEKAMQRRLN